MKIFIATDHAGYDLKEQLKSWLFDGGHDVIDCGAAEYNESDDYPDFMHKAGKMLAEELSHDERARTIILGGSGTGEAIVMNRYPGLRAVVYNGQDIEIVRLAREHNNANVLSIGARFVDFDKAKEVIKIFLETEFSGDERHVRRIQKIDQ